MLAGIFHKGSGLGDQLHRYITVRTLAQDKGYDFGMVNPENFKGASFMNLDMGTPVDPISMPQWNEKDVRDAQGTDIRSYDPEINFVEDNTLIDGYFEDSRYWQHNLHNINEWLKVEPIEVPDDVCVIGFRGGEFYFDPNLGLSPSYFLDGIKVMQGINPEMRFEVHTDDIVKARMELRGLVSDDTKYIQDIGINWRSMRYAKHAIIANSAFYILPRLLQHYEADSWAGRSATTISPRYWARRNTKGPWRPAAYYKQFQYV